MFIWYSTNLYDICTVSGMHIIYKFTIATDNGVYPLGSLCLAHVARLLTRRECWAILLLRLSSSTMKTHCTPFKILQQDVWVNTKSVDKSCILHLQQNPNYKLGIYFLTQNINNSILFFNIHPTLSLRI